MTMIDVSPVYRCMWMLVGGTAENKDPLCGKLATHGTLVGAGTIYLCKYHAGVARRDGWRGVRTLKTTKKGEL